MSAGILMPASYYFTINNTTGGVDFMKIQDFVI